MAEVDKAQTGKPMTLRVATYRALKLLGTDVLKDSRRFLGSIHDISAADETPIFGVLDRNCDATLLRPLVDVLSQQSAQALDEAVRRMQVILVRERMIQSETALQLASELGYALGLYLDIPCSQELRAHATGVEVADVKLWDGEADAILPESDSEKKTAIANDGSPRNEMSEGDGEGRANGTSSLDATRPELNRYEQILNNDRQTISVSHVLMILFCVANAIICSVNAYTETQNRTLGFLTTDPNGVDYTISNMYIMLNAFVALVYGAGILLRKTKHGVALMTFNSVLFMLIPWLTVGIWAAWPAWPGITASHGAYIDSAHALWPTYEMYNTASPYLIYSVLVLIFFAVCTYKRARSSAS